MVVKFMYIPHNDTQNHPFCKLQIVVECLNTKFNEPTNQNSFKVPKVVTNNEQKDITIKRWSTGVINSPISHPSLMCACMWFQQ